MTWDCIRCGEQIDDNFDACFSCGSSRDGVADPDFHKQIDDPLARIHAQQVAASPSMAPATPKKERLEDELLQERFGTEYTRQRQPSTHSVAFGVVSLALGLAGFTVAPLTFGILAIIFGAIAVIGESFIGGAGIFLGVLNLVWFSNLISTYVH